MSAKKDRKKLDGGDVLYHFFEKILKDADQDVYRFFIKKAIDVLGVWMPIEAYERMPIFHPYVKRVQGCRGNAKKGILDMWGSPDVDGCFKDDNTMVKNIANSLTIVSRETWYNGMRGGNYIASHVWRQPTNFAATKALASQRRDLYSFLPNIMWLPKQISKLTDKEGGFAQHYIQALSRRIYKGVRFGAAMKRIVDGCWASLPEPEDIDGVDFPSMDEIAFFKYDSKSVDYRIGIVRELDMILSDILENGSSNKTFRPCRHRYVPGLNNLSRESLGAFAAYISAYVNALD